MDHQAFDRTVTRARKRLAHATRQLAEAQSDKARHRHQRRAHNARRHMSEALWTFDRMAMLHEVDA